MPRIEVTRDYPYNITRELLWDRDGQEVEEFIDKIKSDPSYPALFSYAMSKVLEPKQIDIVIRRYKDGCTFAEIADMYGQHRSYMSHINYTIIRKLRCPPYFSMLMNGLEDYVNKKVQNAYKSGEKGGYLIGYYDGSMTKKSKRSYNILLADTFLSETLTSRLFDMGINTVQDLARMYNYDIQVFKKMGTTIFHTIKELLNHYGLIEKDSDTCPFYESTSYVFRPERVSKDLQQIYDGINLEDLNLSSHAFNVLRRAGYSTLLDVAEADPKKLKQIRNLGAVTYNEICSVLTLYGIRIKEFSEV